MIALLRIKPPPTVLSELDCTHRHLSAPDGTTRHLSHLSHPYMTLIAADLARSGRACPQFRMRVAILYEHPDWFKPLFTALEARGLEVVHIDATSLRWDPAERPDFSLLLNRMSPSSHTRGHGHAVHAAASYIDWVESHGVPVVNGSAA